MKTEILPPGKSPFSTEETTRERLNGYQSEVYGYMDMVIQALDMRIGKSIGFNEGCIRDELYRWYANPNTHIFSLHPAIFNRLRPDNLQHFLFARHYPSGRIEYQIQPDFLSFYCGAGDDKLYKYVSINVENPSSFNIYRSDYRHEGLGAKTNSISVSVNTIGHLHRDQQKNIPLTIIEAQDEMTATLEFDSLQDTDTVSLKEGLVIMDDGFDAWRKTGYCQHGFRFLLENGSLKYNGIKFTWEKDSNLERHYNLREVPDKYSLTASPDNLNQVLIFSYSYQGKITEIKIPLTASITKRVKDTLHGDIYQIEVHSGIAQ